METANRDLWPSDIKVTDVMTPEEILQEQADALDKRTQGLLRAAVKKVAMGDSVALGFDVEAPRAKRSVRLFTVRHRLDREYPAVVDSSEELPEIATKSIGRRQFELPKDYSGDKLSVPASPTEFTAAIERVLAKPEVKGIIFSLISQSQRTPAPR